MRGSQFLGKLYIEGHQEIPLARRILGEGQSIALDAFHSVRLDDLLHGADAQLIARHCRNLEDNAAECLQQGDPRENKNKVNQ